MNYKYAYFFVVGGKIVWSSETSESLLKRADNETDKNRVLDFLESNPAPGSFTILSSGDVALCMN